MPRPRKSPDEVSAVRAAAASARWSKLSKANRRLATAASPRTKVKNK
jgi:hypothetical protein